MSSRVRPWQGWNSEGRRVLIRGLHAFLLLAAVLVPLQLLMQILQRIGWLDLFALWVQPLMALFRLPGELVFAWVAGMTGGVYATVSITLSLGQSQSYTVAQMTTLGLLVLFTHNLVNEVLVGKLAGMPVWFSLLERLGIALLLTVVTSASFHLLGWGQHPFDFPPYFAAQQQSWPQWIREQLMQYAMILTAIVLLMALLRTLELLRVMKVLMVALRVLLRPLKLDDAAGELLLAGLTLGLSYGGALLLTAKKEGLMTRKQLLTVICYLNLCHSLIEDTLLVLAFGSAFFPSVVLRIVMTTAVSWLFVRCYPKVH